MDLLDAVLVKQALHDVVVAAVRGVDRGDAALIAGAFHADADVAAGVFDGKAADYAPAVVAIVRDNLESSFHSLTNEYFEVSGDSARGETYVIAHVITLAEPRARTLTGGRYLDRFERRDSRWAIVQRTFLQDWTMTSPASGETDGVQGGTQARGGWAPDDPSVAFWRGGGQAE